MPLYKAMMGFEYKVTDIARLEIEAASKTEAMIALQRMVEDPNAMFNLHWEDGEIVNGDYKLVGEPELVDEKVP